MYGIEETHILKLYFVVLLAVAEALLFVMSGAVVCQAVSVRVVGEDRLKVISGGAFVETKTTSVQGRRREVFPPKGVVDIPAAKALQCSVYTAALLSTITGSGHISHGSAPPRRPLNSPLFVSVSCLFILSILS